MAKKLNPVTIGLYVTSASAPAQAFVVNVNEYQLELFQEANRHRYLLARTQEELVKDIKVLVILSAMGLLTLDSVEQAVDSLAEDDRDGSGAAGVLSEENQADADELADLAIAAHGSLTSHMREVAALTSDTGITETFVISL